MKIDRRVHLSRIVEKINKNKEYAEKIGTKDKSKYILKEEKEYIVEKNIHNKTYFIIHRRNDI